VVTEPISPGEAQNWFDNGMALCRRVYGASFEPLRTHVETIAPEVFRWMIVEGYGKVLSRPGVSAADRELAVVASLIIENRPKQLDSHLRGALNVGAGRALLSTIIEDLKETAPDGYGTAVSLLNGLDSD
jgi:4-carboxymuconolactone decarboxylase